MSNLTVKRIARPTVWSDPVPHQGIVVGFLHDPDGGPYAIVREGSSLVRVYLNELTVVLDELGLETT